MGHINETKNDLDEVNEYNRSLYGAKRVIENLSPSSIGFVVDGYGGVSLLISLGTEACESDWGNGPYTRVKARVALTIAEGRDATHPTMCPAWGVQDEKFKILRRKVEDRLHKDAIAMLQCAAILNIK